MKDLQKALNYARSQAYNEQLPTENRIAYIEDLIALKAALAVIEGHFGPYDDDHWLWREDWK